VKKCAVFFVIKGGGLHASAVEAIGFVSRRERLDSLTDPLLTAVSDCDSRGAHGWKNGRNFLKAAIDEARMVRGIFEKDVPKVPEPHGGTGDGLLKWPSLEERPLLTHQVFVVVGQKAGIVRCHKDDLWYHVYSKK
jgi:hypothetical protein